MEPKDAELTTLVRAGLSHPTGVAVDRSFNVYIADTGNNAIKEWDPENRRSHVAGGCTAAR